MLDFVPSKYYLNYCKENGIDFTDRKYAALLLRCSMISLYRTLDELKMIAKRTDDKELKMEIEEYIAYQNRQIELFKDNSDNCCIYVVAYGSSYFTSFEAAYEAAAAEFKRTSSCLDRITIEKRVLFGSHHTGAHNEYNVVFDEHGNIINFIGGECFRGSILYKKISIENPFERGDIVMNCCSREIGVVETSRERWAESSMYFYKKDKNITLENPCIHVTAVSRYGKPYTLRWEPFILEKVDSFDTSGKDADILRFISAFLRGENYNDSFGFITVQKLLSIVDTEILDKDIDHRVFACAEKK